MLAPPHCGVNFQEEANVPLLWFCYSAPPIIMSAKTFALLTT